MKQHIAIDKATPNVGALDFSHLLDAPAGKHGHVTVKDGHFYFADGTRARFIGFNLPTRSNTPDHETADKLAARFASLGVNVIRLHAADAPIGDGPGSWSSCREAPMKAALPALFTRMGWTGSTISGPGSRSMASTCTLISL